MRETSYARAASFLLFDRRGHVAALAAGAALWLVAWPVFVVAVPVAVICDALDSRKEMKR